MAAEPGGPSRETGKRRGSPQRPDHPPCGSHSRFAILAAKQNADRLDGLLYFKRANNPQPEGFDSAAGGGPSPILPDGTLVSLPIPLGPSPVTYRDVYHNGSPLADLVTPLSRGRVTADHPCHLDPDLRRESRARLPGWRPIFGQCGPALSHLRNEGVKPGDLFIFFGWFREVIRERRFPAVLA